MKSRPRVDGAVGSESAEKGVNEAGIRPSFRIRRAKVDVK